MSQDKSQTTTLESLPTRVVRLEKENADLKRLVGRLTLVAEDLAAGTFDPGAEALAAIYCGRNLIYG